MDECYLNPNACMYGNRLYVALFRAEMRESIKVALYYIQDLYLWTLDDCMFAFELAGPPTKVRDIPGVTDVFEPEEGTLREVGGICYMGPIELLEDV